MSIRDELAPAQEEAQTFLAQQGLKPKVFSFSNLFEFFNNIPGVARLIAKEPEIIFLVFVQFIVIYLSYLAWIQMIKWIPDSVWNEIVRASEKHQAQPYAYFIDLLMFGWAFIIVTVASLPVSICNAAMVAVYNLRASGEKTSLGECLGIATLHSGKIWIFTTIDAWITVRAIFDRLPKKNAPPRTALDELLYYAWKVATIAVTQSLVIGKGFIDAGKDSIKLLTTQTTRVICLRLGYSAVCWIIGILSYFGTLLYYVKFGDSGYGPHWLYNFYLLIGTPLFFSIGIVTVIVRPFYFLAVSKLYSEVIDVTAETRNEVDMVDSDTLLRLSWVRLLFFLLLAIIIFLLVFGNQIGLVDWVSQLIQG